MAAHFFIQVSRPLSARGGTLQAPLCLPPRPCPKKTRRALIMKSQREGRILTKGRINKSRRPPCSASVDAMKEGVGRKSGSSPPAPNSALLSSSRSLRSWSSYSDASLPTSSSAGTSLLTSVVEKADSSSDGGTARRGSEPVFIW